MQGSLEDTLEDIFLRSESQWCSNLSEVAQQKPVRKAVKLEFLGLDCLAWLGPC